MLRTPSSTTLSNLIFLRSAHFVYPLALAR
jgi:hypothetical protein